MAPGGETTEYLIAPEGSKIVQYLRDLAGAHELLFFLTWREIKLRYKQTVLGILWAVLQPAATAVVVATLFSASVAPGDRSSRSFLFASLVLWTFFAQAVANSSNSLIASQSLITRVYFPRIVLPVAGALAAVVDLICASGVLLVVLGVSGEALTWRAALAPAFAFMALLAALALGLWLAAVNARYRDVRYAVPFLVQLLLFASPVLYPRSALPARFQPWLDLNPLSAALEGYRWSLLGSPPPSRSCVLVALTVSALGALAGAAYLRRVERTVADYV